MLLQLIYLSLPSRERGLKHTNLARCRCCDKSLPSRERGLKLITGRDITGDLIVAPFTGAWIETRRWIHRVSKQCVAPFTGAWIETFCMILY